MFQITENDINIVLKKYQSEKQLCIHCRDEPIEQLCQDTCWKGISERHICFSFHVLSLPFDMYPFTGH